MPLVTRTGRILPVRRDGEALLLKLATDEDERAAGALLAWWNGDGAARVFARDERALLLERARGRGLSAAWSMEDGTSPVVALRVAGLAAAELER